MHNVYREQLQCLILLMKYSPSCSVDSKHTVGRRCAALLLVSPDLEPGPRHVRLSRKQETCNIFGIAVEVDDH